jgi:hypothetical protein
MSKCLTVVAFVLFVLTGAMGLRSIAVTHAATSSGSSIAKQGGAPRPMPRPGGR